MKTILALKKQTILADATARRGRSSSTVVATGAIVRVGADPTNSTPPAWWPTTLAWPPAATPPPGWNSALKWPPMTSAELSAGISASMTTAPSPPAESGLSPATKDGIAAAGGAVIGGVIAKLAIGAAALPIAGGVVVGALIGHVIYALATGNEVTKVATKGCGCGGPPAAREWPVAR